MLTVMTSSGSATSEAPSAAASHADLPISLCRWMFSNTTMELSTNVPTARASPPNGYLDRRRISRRPHILEIHRDTVDDFHREIIHLLDERNDAIAVHVVIEVADLYVPRRGQEVFCVDCLDDIVRADPARQHLLAIEKDRDLPHRSTERRWPEGKGARAEA